MKYFEKLNVRLHRLGIFQGNPDPKSKWIVIATRSGLLIIYISYFLAPTWYFVFEAQTPREHSESLIFVFASLLVLSWYSAFIFQHEKYADLLDELNSIIENSKLQAKRSNNRN